MSKVNLHVIVALGLLVASGCALETEPYQEEDNDAEAAEATEWEEATDNSGSHCVVDASEPEPTCYATFSEAMAAATGGRITDAPDDVSAALADDGLAARIDALGLEDVAQISASSVVMAIFWEHWYFEGAAVVIKGSTCSDTLDDVDFAWPRLTRMNDRISSFRCYNNCWCKLFEHWYYGGSCYGYYERADKIVGNMNDAASSFWVS